MSEVIYHSQVESYSPRANDKFVLVLEPLARGLVWYSPIITRFDELKELKEEYDNYGLPIKVHGCVIDTVCSNVKTGIMTLGLSMKQVTISPLVFGENADGSYSDNGLYHSETSFKKDLTAKLTNPDDVQHCLRNYCSAQLIKIL